MSKVELMVPEQDVIAVTEALADLGVFHLVDASYLTTRDGTRPSEFWQEQARTFTALERRLLRVMQMLGVSEGELSSTERVHSIEADVARTALGNLEGLTRACVRESEEQKQKLAELQAHVRHLTPLRDLDVEVEALRSLRYIWHMVGTIPAGNLERLHTSLAHVPSVLSVLRREDHLAVVTLFGSQRDADILGRAARSAYLNPIDLPEMYRGTPAEVIEALSAGIARAKEHVTACQMEVERLHQARIPQLRNLLWRIRASRRLSEAIARFGRLHYSYLVLGWVPTQQAGSLRQRVSLASERVLFDMQETDREEVTDEVPTALRFPRMLQGFQQLVTNYGAPRYDEIDPTPLLVLTFPLIFGIMFGDVGHGLVLSLIGLLLASGRLVSLRTFRGLGSLVALCGLASAVFGLLYGSVFGMEDLLPALWLRPLESITDILLASVGIGVLLLNVGFAANLVNSWLVHDWAGLLFRSRGIAGLLLYWSLLGLAARLLLNDAPLSAAVSLSALLLGSAGITLSEPLGRLFHGQRPLFESGVVATLTQSFFEVFETVISLLSNSLSFVRVGAFAVAHGGLSAVVFILARQVSPRPGPVYWLAVALGQLGVVGLEGLIVSIQTMRLEYYEFFSRFFTGGGLSFRPLTLTQLPGDQPRPPQGR